MKRFWLVEFISVFSTYNICVSILFSCPGCCIPKLIIGLKPWRISFLTISFFHWIIEFKIPYWGFSIRNCFWSFIRFQISFTKTSAPFFFICRMRREQSFLAITSEKSRSSDIMLLLIIVKFASTFESVKCILKTLFLIKTTSSNFWISPSKFWISIHAWNETSIFWNRIVFLINRFL